MISKEKLHDMYWSQGMSMPQIAEVVGVAYNTINRWMKQHNIELRTHSESLAKRSRKPSREELGEMYWNQERSISDIAIDIGVKDSTVYRWTRECGIELCTHSESKLRGVHKPSKKELNQMYCDQGMSQPEIASEIGVSISTISKWMKLCGIEPRTLSEARLNGNFKGEKSGGWRGGISGGRYCYKFNRAFKEAVCERDDYICQLCGCEQKLNGEKLSVHHIHYDKENCYPDVVALCRSCNAKVNGNRDYWEDYFETHLISRGLSNWSAN